MSFKYLDMENYKRKSHFQYFNSLAYPYVGTTMDINITDLLRTVKEKQLPFFLTFCYCVSRAANSVPEFRQRILDGAIVEYENCRTSHTVALEDETYCYCVLESKMPFRDFLPYAVNAQEISRRERSVSDDENDGRELIFISTLPWFSYTSIVQPVPVPADSNPRITWGKYRQVNGEVMIPVTVLCHHALVDGLHIAGFYDKLREQMEKVSICDWDRI